MGTNTAMFADSIPGDYDKYLGPFLFEFYAEDLARRLTIDAGGALLEVACGTGIATEFLRRAIPTGASIVATDVSEPMLALARSRRGHLPDVRFQQADAVALPFEDGCFSAVAQQFGLMFFPDKLLALREAHRVLAPGGRLVFSVWDNLTSNPFVRVAQDTIATFFDESPPQFLYLPWSYHEHESIRALVSEAGFATCELQTVTHTATRLSPRDVAAGLVRGNPTVNEVRERANGSVDDVVNAVADTLGRAFGSDPLRVPMQAIVVTAERSPNSGPSGPSRSDRSSSSPRASRPLNPTRH